jgi:hypothetical protein
MFYKSRGQNTNAIQFRQLTLLIFIGGLMACRGDAYCPEEALSKEDAKRIK